MDKMKMYSFSTAALFPRTAEESLRLIKGAGFSFAELMPQCFADIGDEVLRAAEKNGIQVASVHYPLVLFSMLYNAGEGMVPETRTLGRKITAFCRQLGCTVLVVHPHEPVKEKAMKTRLEDPIIGNLRALADECGRNSLILAVENSPKGPGRTPEGLLEYVRELGEGREWVKPMVDTTESCEAGIAPEKFISVVHPVHMHISDHAGEAKHIPAGEGESDWVAIRESLKDYRGFRTLEPSYRFYLDEPEKQLEKAYHFVTEQL
ncbi:MAG: sugar phosphate isomerase/epimerase [Spirochaetaceae bacterium]|nr:sugar phosphate isomerase/epimerase [Spirochaetaceae bacterium]